MDVDKLNVFEDYPSKKRNIMLTVLDSLVADIDFDTDMGNIESVLNGIEYNRQTKFKNAEIFQKRYRCDALDEFEISEIIGAAIGMAYFEKFCT